MKLLVLGTWCGATASDLPSGMPFRRLCGISLLVSAMVVGAGLYLGSRPASLDVAPPPETTRVPVPMEEVAEAPAPINQPVRELPNSFPRKTRRPSYRESSASVSIDQVNFDPKRDLVEVYDDRVWWESDNDEAQGDTEDDHLVHYALEESLRRVIELVVQEGGTLEVHDAYRATGVHSPKSLHKQGRAVDLTCDELGLERLAILTWAAGFDWVYHEAPKRGGHHVHASVRPDRDPYVPIMIRK